MLVASLVASMMGVFSILFLEMHRTEFQEITSDKKGETRERFFFSTSDFTAMEWIEKNEEFERAGKLYDVSAIERTEGGYVVYCENDNWEEEFIALFGAWKTHKQSDGKMKFLFHPMYFTEVLSCSPTYLVMNFSTLDHLSACTASHVLRLEKPPRISKG